MFDKKIFGLRLRSWFYAMLTIVGIFGVIILAGVLGTGPFLFLFAVIFGIVFAAWVIDGVQDDKEKKF